MNTSKLLISIAAIMTLVAIIFIVIALSHPELSFPWNNTVTCILYVAYIAAMIVLYIMGFAKRNR